MNVLAVNLSVNFTGAISTKKNEAAKNSLERSPACDTTAFKGYHSCLEADGERLVNDIISSTKDKTIGYEYLFGNKGEEIARKSCENLKTLIKNENYSELLDKISEYEKKIVTISNLANNERQLIQKGDGYYYNHQTNSLIAALSCMTMCALTTILTSAPDDKDPENTELINKVCKTIDHPFSHSLEFALEDEYLRLLEISKQRLKDLKGI